MYHDVDGKTAAEDVVTDRPVRVRLVERRLQTLDRQGKLATDEDEGLCCADRVRTDEGPFDQLMRIPLDQGVVLERRRLALVAVDRQIDGLSLTKHAPLATGLEAGAATAEHVGHVD